MTVAACIPASLQAAIRGAEKRRSAPFTIPEHKLVLSQFEGTDVDDYPWGFTESTLISLEWAGSPGASYPLTFAALDAKDQRLYFEHGFDGTALLAISTAKEQPQLDLLFLQRLFASNGAKFNTGVIDGPPSSVRLGVAADAAFVVDLFWSAFDNRDCWDQLREEFPCVWNDEYENPEEPDVTGAVEGMWRDEFYRAGGYRAKRMSERSLEDAEFAAFVEGKLDGIVPPPLHRIPRVQDWSAPMNKYRMVLRYLDEVVG